MPGSALVQRVLMLVRCPFPVEARPPAWWCWSLPSLVVLTTLASSTLCLRFTAVDPRPETASHARRGTRAFRMARLILPAQSANPRGRTPLFELPIRLPAHFELTLGVWGDRSSLRLTRVVGQRLGVPAETAPEPPNTPGWHQVAVRRDRGGVHLVVDGRAVPTDPDLDIMTTWLSVEAAPDYPAQFRDLVLRW